MSNDPEVVQWTEPNISFDEANDKVLLNLGVVSLPPQVDPDNTERILTVVTDLVNQMIEEDILPELLTPDDVPDYSDGIIDTDDDDTTSYIKSEADAFEDEFGEFPEDF